MLSPSNVSVICVSGTSVYPSTAVDTNVVPRSESATEATVVVVARRRRGHAASWWSPPRAVLARRCDRGLGLSSSPHATSATEATTERAQRPQDFMTVGR
jgi:hypothetical protein